MAQRGTAMTLMPLRYDAVMRGCGLWAVFHAKDYLPKPTVVYFLRLRRGTSQHKTRETNAGGGGVRRNTRRVKPTPEEEECGYTIRDACTIRSAHALNYVVENVTVSLHYWYHACDETLDGQTAQLAAYFL